MPKENLSLLYWGLCPTLSSHFTRFLRLINVARARLWSKPASLPHSDMTTKSWRDHPVRYDAFTRGD